MDVRCTIDTCPNRPYSRGLCEMHYRRLLRTGDLRVDEPKRGMTEPSPCTVAPCPHPAEARGWCHGHYQRHLRHGNVAAGEPLSRRKQPETCMVDGCPQATHSHGLCGTHRERRKKHGDVLAEIPVRPQTRLEPPAACIIDRCRGRLVEWGLCAAHHAQQIAHGDVLTPELLRVLTGEGWLNHGYRNVSVPKMLRHLANGETKIGEHRLVVALRMGRSLLPDEVVHHINGVRTDNRPENLELWSTSHPQGQRVGDKVQWALELLQRYRPDLHRQLENGF